MILITGQIWGFKAVRCSLMLSDKAFRSYPPSRKEMILPLEWILAISTIIFVISKKSLDSKFILANGSLICASKPAEISIISGLNLSTGLRILFSKIFINSLPFVPAFKVALKILPTPFSSSAPVPGNKGNSCDEA